MKEETGTLPGRLHDAMVDWQKRHFTDYDYLVENWSKFYKREPFSLIYKFGELQSPEITVGKFKGREKFHKVRQMPDELVVHAAKIVKAQCSTELGSIQQHRGSVHKTTDASAQFDIFRVMAEEFRHAYQMLAVLARDDWGQTGRNLAEETIEELLGMHTGTHVLDAFNVYFDSFVDNVTFCAIIDRVGKYQLTMQQVFSYAPMASSMGPMLREEGFHMSSGMKPVRVWAREAAQGDGNVSVAVIQKHVNKWFPRGLEMFGDERGGRSNIDFGFKDLVNRDALNQYVAEIKTEVVDTVNYEVVHARTGQADRREATALADRIVERGEAEQGVRPEELAFVPDTSWYRRRGEHEFMMRDLRGRPIGDLKSYLNYARRQLPEAYVTTPDWTNYVQNMNRKIAGQDVKEDALPFYG